MAKKAPNSGTCPWALSDPLLLPYHNTEWGVPVHDDRKHFEFLILEGAQAGLSWLTILKKREGYRKAFSNFDPKKVAAYDAVRIEKLMLNPGIIRNRLKIKAAVGNAKCFLAIQKEFGSFDIYCWSFVGGKPKVNRWKKQSQLPALTKESDAFSKDLKKTRIPLRWIHHHLCAYAGGRHGERPPCHLPPPPRSLSLFLIIPTARPTIQIALPVMRGFWKNPFSAVFGEGLKE